LPKAEPEQLQSEDLADPRAELIRQLLEYKKFKDAANLLGAAADETKKRFPRPGTIIEQLKPGTEPQIDIEQVSGWDLLEAFDSIMEATGAGLDISHIKDDTPIDLYQIEILHRLQTQGPMSFERIFESKTSRIVMVGLFLALLELVREKLVQVKQQGSSEQLYLRSLADEPAEQAVQKAIIASAEVDNEQVAKTQLRDQPPIPIAELPPEDQQRASAIEYEKTESAKNHKQRTEN